jgi:DNA-binding MarR family transcriptional regulator
MGGASEIPLGWLTISDLAREKGVDKSAISRRVSRLEEQGLLTTRTTGRVKLVNLAEFDRAIANTGNAVQELNARGATAADEGDGSGNPILAREQARRAAYDADLKSLDLQERLKNLVKADEMTLAVTEVAMALAQAIDALPGRAEALAAVVGKDGATGLRAALKAVARELRETLARAAERFGERPEAEEAAEAVEPEEAAA